MADMATIVHSIMYGWHCYHLNCNGWYYLVNIKVQRNKYCWHGYHNKCLTYSFSGSLYLVWLAWLPLPWHNLYCLCEQNASLYLVWLAWMSLQLLEMKTLFDGRGSHSNYLWRNPCCFLVNALVHCTFLWLAWLPLCWSAYVYIR